MSTEIDEDWHIQWAIPVSSAKGGYFEQLVISREEAVEYGDELVNMLRVDGKMLRDRGINPEEPFGWKIKDGGIRTKQISRRTLESVAESDHPDSLRAKKKLESRAKQRIRNSE